MTKSADIVDTVTGMSRKVSFAQVLGHVVRQHRVEVGALQSDVVSAKLSLSSVSRLEAGRQAATVAQLRSITGTLGLTSWKVLREAEAVWAKIELKDRED